MAMLLLPMLGLLSSCSSDDDIVFDHEKAAFDIQADKLVFYEEHQIPKEVMPIIEKIQSKLKELEAFR